MSVAPYTRETLQRIRRGVSHLDLGWDLTFYQSICRKHGIEQGIAYVRSLEPPKPKPAEPERRKMIHRARMFPQGSEELTCPMPATMRAALKDFARSKHVRPAEVIRKSVALALNGEALLRDYSDTYPGICSSYTTATLSRDTMETIAQRSAALNINRTEYIRCALAAHLGAAA